MERPEIFSILSVCIEKQVVVNFDFKIELAFQKKKIKKRNLSFDGDLYKCTSILWIHMYLDRTYTPYSCQLLSRQRNI